MSIAAEYSLKQSKLHISLDSNLTIKSLLELKNVVPGSELHLCGELNHLKDGYKFGIGFMMG
jgi:Eukaryotic porin